MHRPGAALNAAASATSGLAICRPGPYTSRLRPGEVHVWRADLDSAAAGLPDRWRILTDEERASAGRRRFAVDRERAGTGRAILRLLIGRYLGRQPEDLSFELGAHGKPRLAGEAPDLRFNLSHSGRLAVYAFSQGIEVGVDVQRAEPVEVADLAAAGFLTERENGALASLPDRQRQSALLRTWVRKEALLKGLGVGLTSDAGEIDVGVGWEVTGPGGALEIAHPAGGWRLIDLELGPGIVGCLAHRGRARVSAWVWEADWG